ncbi:hypothetical protein GGI1_17318 [Acidithiobacillus sp. GGI-221]|nr:hypothetical protein GGI1_17318 [Acidithiobacillus sp. GGI-221]
MFLSEAMLCRSSHQGVFRLLQEQGLIGKDAIYGCQRAA